MIKQHCDICDGVIPGTESYRTINFGRGYNHNIDTGYDPLVICKRCWHRMLESVGAEELYKEVDIKPKRPQSVGNIGSILKEVVQGPKMCNYCKHLNSEVCFSCLSDDCKEFTKWEAKDENN